MGSSETTASPAAFVRQVAGLAPERLQRLTGDQLTLLRAIGNGRAVRDLCSDPASRERVLALLRNLTALGVVELRSEDSDDIPIHDMTELGDLNESERQLLGENVDLAGWEKRRFIAVMRAVELGNLFEVLQVSPKASKRDLKRAYFQLSKEYHPDRYYGRNLGSFKPILDHIFSALSQFVKTLKDSRTVTDDMPKIGAPKRRQAERYPFTVHVSVHSHAWDQPVEMVTQDVSSGGAFLVTEAIARTGDSLEIELEIGDVKHRIAAAVVTARAPDEAQRAGRNPGLGVRFTDASDQTLHMVLGLARRMIPVPAGANVPEAPPPPRARLARGTASMSRDPIIGIDLGTTHTSVSAAIGSRVHMLNWPGGATSIPSAVAFPERGRVVVGAEARKLQLRDPARVVSSAKRLLGRSSSDPELAGFLAGSHLDLVSGPDESIVVKMWGEQYAMAQVLAYLFAAAKRVAEANLRQRVSRAVVTIPVSFTGERAALLRRAASMAHLDVVAVIEEPNAAALANRHVEGFGDRVGVYDFGGGTFDFSVVDASRGEFRVLATAGDSWLGGDDFDLAVAEASADAFWRAHGVDLRQRAVEWQYLVFSCERAKRQLSTDSSAQIIVPEAMRTQKGAFDLRIRLSRDKVEPLWSDAIARSLHTCTQTLSLSGTRPSELSAIYLSGGTSNIPAIRRALVRRFGVPVRVAAPVESAVCLGAGIHAAQLERCLPTTLTARSD